MTPLRRAALTLVLLIFAVIGSGMAAQADAPFDVRGDISDNAGVLGDDTATVQRALDDFTDETGFQLFVVYVESFDGLSGADWSDQAALVSGLGTTDILLAVATDDRRYGIAVPTEHTISDDEFEKVEIDEIRPRLSDDDWAGAAIAAAEGYTAAAKDSGLPWGAIVIGGVVVAGAGAFVVHRIRRRYDDTHVVLDEHGQPVDPLSRLSTDELDTRASSDLVAIDDALRTSEQELGFAEAQFGTDATRGFAETLAAGRETVKAAFVLRQRLDDDEPEDDAERRGLAGEIIRMCESVDGSLDDQVAEFDRLRDLQARAPAVLDEVGTRADEIALRVPRARTVLTQLAAAHPATSLTSVVHNPDQAGALVTTATAQVAEGRAAVTADDRAAAVVHARAAEDAVAQATSLLDAVDHADADLRAAPGRIAERLTSLGLDLDDAARLAPGDAGIASAVTAARAAVATGQQAGHDPLAAARDLEQAEATLDELLAPHRAAAAEAAKARVALTESLGRVTSKIKAVSDYIDTRRGAVGAEARTRLSEAARHLDRAQQVLDTDPSAALAALQKADTFVGDAERLAQQDVGTWERSQRQSSGTGSGINSMVLGGILIDALSRGGSSKSPRSSRGPGSFGGSGTRGRRGGGGRF